MDVKQAIVNGRWNLWLPDNIADWDAITGDYTAKRGWEFERFESFRQHLKWGDRFYDIGAEHGWISAIIAREFVGAKHMVLFEPSPEFWVNIRKTWQYNGLNDPAGCWPGFADDIHRQPSRGAFVRADVWPGFADASRPEVPGMPYRSLRDPDETGPLSVSIDDFVKGSGLSPQALNIDVEGAELLVLRGASKELNFGELSNVWVSVHSDLMENFSHTPEMLHEYMDECGWKGEHLETDHEEHWWFHRV